MPVRGAVHPITVMPIAGRWSAMRLADIRQNAVLGVNRMSNLNQPQFNRRTMGRIAVKHMTTLVLVILSYHIFMIVTLGLFKSINDTCYMNTGATPRFCEWYSIPVVNSCEAGWIFLLSVMAPVATGYFSSSPYLAIASFIVAISSLFYMFLFDAFLSIYMLHYINWLL